MRTFYVVIPSEQWWKEYRNQPKYLYWRHKRHAFESANDTGGFVIECIGNIPPEIKLREF